MIYHILDKQFNPLTVIDTEAEDGIVVEDDIHTASIINGTLLNTLTLDVIKNTGLRINDYDSNAPYETSFIKEGVYIVFSNELKENICLYVRTIESEKEDVRPISAVDIGTELRNGSASVFNSNNPQIIEYYVKRELYDTGWEIGLNELGADIKRLIDTSSSETPLARLQKICESFDCEMTFTVDFQNTKVKKKLLNIRKRLGSDKTSKVLYSGVDVISMEKSVDIDDVITAIEDTNRGFDNLSTGDGRFFTRYGESIIYDRESNALYGQGNTQEERFTGFITGREESSFDTPIDNFNELKAILIEKSQPNFSAEVDMLFNDGDFEIGDWLTFVDEDYNPPLRLKARVISKELHPTDVTENKAIISNSKLLDSKISSDLKALQNRLNKPKSDYRVYINSNNGTSFIDGESKTTIITASVTKNGEDVTQTIKPKDLLWSKINSDGSHDVNWERSNAESGLSVIVTDSNFEGVASIRCTLTKYDNQFVQAIHFLNGLRDVARKVLRLQNPDTVTSILISDVHYATDSILREDLENYNRSVNHVKNAVELTHMIDVDYILLNGDTHDGSTANKSIAKSNLSEPISILGMSDAPYFVSWGNHCNNSWGDAITDQIKKVLKNYQSKTPMEYPHGKGKNIITNKELYEIITRPSTIFDIVENPIDKAGYYYYDVPKKKTRVFILNPHNIPDTLDPDGYMKYVSLNVCGYRQQQITWLYESLKQMPQDYTACIYQHYNFGKRFSDDMPYYPYNYEMIDGLIDAFATGGSYSKTYNTNKDFKASISATFFGFKGKLAFLAHGHTHNDRITKDNNGTVNYSIGCSVSRPKKSQGDRPLGKLQEDLWDVVVLNTKTRHVDLIRFGQGSDRSFDY